MKFNPGDPVWARCTPVGPAPEHVSDGHAYPGEHPAVVIELIHTDLYAIEVFDCRSTAPDGQWVIRERYLRPRRDDYQQHEARITMRDVRNALKDNLPLREFEEVI